jgi:hypothetical protein
VRLRIRPTRMAATACLVAVARWTLVQLDFEAQVLH